MLNQTKQSKEKNNGIQHKPHEFGMIAGPTPDIHQLLETVGSLKEYIIRFNEDGTDDIH